MRGISITITDLNTSALELICLYFTSQLYQVICYSHQSICVSCLLLLHGVSQCDTHLVRDVWLCNSSNDRIDLDIELSPSLLRYLLFKLKK